MTNDVIQDQMAYYRARAGEYDEWFYRVGRYDRGAAMNQIWFDEVAQVQKSLHSLPRAEDILELACGTGIWTKELVQMGDHVTALDASAEVIAINRGKIQNLTPQPPLHHMERGSKELGKVEYVQADVFAWEPERAYDMVFFGFWLSHVPPERLDGFLDKVRRALKLGGRLFALDSLPDPTSSARNHEAYQPEGIYHTRKLNDGQEFTIVKIFYEPDALQAKLVEHGIETTVKSSGRYFWYARGVKS
ncbi:MAG: class I SAM-dependent methyltransferase [Anaerolineae bacterium]|nr:class I SAM-dependent methyltransferase [Anaerolineae bacterium]